MFPYSDGIWGQFLPILRSFLKSLRVVSCGIEMVSVIRKKIFLFYLLSKMFEKTHVKTHDRVLLKYACQGRTEI